MKGKVTALIPTYQRPEYLRRAISSVLRQTYSHLQVSVFDNASGDNTEEVVRSLSASDARIKYHRHAHNLGALANFKYAFQSLDTPFFSIISDDDFLARDFYENAVSVLNDHPDVGFVILNTLAVDENANLIGNFPTTNKLSLYCDQNRLDSLHSGDVASTWTAMVFRKEVAQIYAHMDNRYDGGMDIRFVFNAAARYNYAYLSKVGAFLTSHPDTSRAAGKNFSLMHHGVQMSRYAEIFYDKSVPEHIRDRAAFYSRSLLLNAPSYKKAAMGTLKRIIKHCCHGTSYTGKIVESDICCFRYEGYLKTAMVLNFIYRNRAARILFRALFSRYNENLINKHRSEMMELQNGIYRQLYEDIKEISLVGPRPPLKSAQSI